MRPLHAFAGAFAFAIILTFWLATVTVEAFGTAADVAAVKSAILWGLGLLVPALMLTGLTGHRLAGRRTQPLIAAKRRRMQLAAGNGLAVLVPAAVFLAWQARAGHFDAAFYTVQAVELAAGALNLTLLGLNGRDGWRLRRRPAAALGARS